MKKIKDLLLVIDMQNVYMPGQEWACPTMPERIKSIKNLLDSKAADYAVFTQFLAAEKPRGTWKEYNEVNAEINQNEYLNAIVDELQPYLKDSGEESGKIAVYTKSEYSSLKNNELLKMARETENLVLTGVVAECCVLATMMEAIDLGCRVIYLTDCVSGQSEQNEAAIQKIAESFAPLHTEVMDSAEYIRTRLQ